MYVKKDVIKKKKKQKKALNIFLNVNLPIMYQYHDGANVCASLRIKNIKKGQNSGHCMSQLLALPSCLHLSMDTHLTFLSRHLVHFKLY